MFHIVIHAKPTGVLRRQTARICELELNPVKLEKGIQTRFSHSFEDVQRSFANLERMFLEPDGSFVWVVETTAYRYQLDGCLIDDGEKLVSAELKANCDNATLERFLIALGWPSQSFLFQLVQHGVYLDEDDFRQVLPELLSAQRPKL